MYRGGAHAPTKYLHHRFVPHKSSSPSDINQGSHKADQNQLQNTHSLYRCGLSVHGTASSCQPICERRHNLHTASWSIPQILSNTPGTIRVLQVLYTNNLDSAIFKYNPYSSTKKHQICSSSSISSPKTTFKTPNSEIMFRGHFPIQSSTVSMHISNHCQHRHQLLQYLVHELLPPYQINHSTIFLKAKQSSIVQKTWREKI